MIHVADSIAMSFTMQDNGLGLAPTALGAIDISRPYLEVEGAGLCEILDGVGHISDAGNEAVVLIAFLGRTD